MNYRSLTENDYVIYVESEELLITDAQSALDLMMTIKYEKDCSRIVIDRSNICDDFFRLSTGIAGEVVQKFINYHMKLAIVGDFSIYRSKPLKDFIYECNKGKDIFFVDNLMQAVEKLSMAR